MVRSKKPSEFGGVPGRLQPLPHEPSSQENLSLIYGTEPAPPFRDDHALTEEVIPPTERRR